MTQIANAENFWREAEDLGRAALIYLEYWEALGLAALDIDIPAPSLPRPAAGRASSPPPPPRRGAAPSPSLWAGQAANLSALREKTAACRACPLGRDKDGAEEASPGRGPFEAGEKILMAFVGEGPEIFDGAERDLLAAMIEKGLKLAPDEFYVTSLIKCPKNPAGEIPKGAAPECLPIAERELALLRPPLILALGQAPGRLLSGRLREHLGILRNQTHSVAGLPKSWLRVTYGLDDLLTTPELKKEAWKDLRKFIPVIEKLRADKT